MTKATPTETLDSVLKNIKKIELDFNKIIAQIEEKQGLYRSNEREAEIFENLKKHLISIQNEISNIIDSSPLQKGQTSTIGATGQPVIVRCKSWDDFKSQASNAQNVSFLCREEEKIFQVDAVKGNIIYTYSGQMPETKLTLKAWLSKKLEVEENRVMEGVLALGQ